MTVKAPFQPIYGSNQVATAAATSASLPINQAARSIRVLNNGAGSAYFRVYSSTDGSPGTASAADYPILPGVSVTLSKSLGQDRVAFLSTAGTTLEIITGEGW